MTTITREHLTLAAKAAGYTVHRGISGGVAVRTRDGIADVWQPHTNVYDTWQLAADCKMRIDFDAKYVSYLVDERRYREPFDGDTGITAAEAVTLAASEIGRAME